jgi:DNA-binding transcriptional MerR regulator
LGNQRTAAPVDEALQWLVVQSRLLEYGYNLKDIRTLYDAYQKANPTQHVAFKNPDGQSLNFALERNLLNNVPEPSETLQFSGGTMFTSFRPHLQGKQDF